MPRKYLKSRQKSLKKKSLRRKSHKKKSLRRSLIKRKSLKRRYSRKRDGMNREEEKELDLTYLDYMEIENPFEPFEVHKVLDSDKYDTAEIINREGTKFTVRGYTMEPIKHTDKKSKFTKKEIKSLLEMFGDENMTDYNMEDIDHLVPKEDIPLGVDVAYFGKQYKCQLCEFNGDKDDVKKHLKEVHNKDMFSCHLCMYEAFRKEHLKNHLKNIHKSYSGS